MLVVHETIRLKELKIYRKAMVKDQVFKNIKELDDQIEELEVSVSCNSKSFVKMLLSWFRYQCNKNSKEKCYNTTETDVYQNSVNKISFMNLFW